jgi:hypothetical protein
MGGNPLSSPCGKGKKVGRKTEIFLSRRSGKSERRDEKQRSFVKEKREG